MDGRATASIYMEIETELGTTADTWKIRDGPVLKLIQMYLGLRSLFNCEEPNNATSFSIQIRRFNKGFYIASMQIKTRQRAVSAYIHRKLILWSSIDGSVQFDLGCSSWRWSS